MARLLVGLVGGVSGADVFLGGLVGEVGEVGEIGGATMFNVVSSRANLNSLMRLFLSVMKSTSLTLKLGRCV